MLRVRLSARLDGAGRRRRCGGAFDDVMTARKVRGRRLLRRAHARRRPRADEALVLRQALAGMLWGKQFYHYDVARWLDGDPAEPPPPASRAAGATPAGGTSTTPTSSRCPTPGSTPGTRPGTWPSTASRWPTSTRGSPRTSSCCCCREWYMHPGGQLPAYEWAFGDVNPPVHAWAALRVFEIDGARDVDFLARVFHKLLLNFTWWVNRKDAEGDNVFEGGFLGLDNIGPIDRSAALPWPGVLEQTDGTAWMAMYCLNLLEIALVLARARPGLRGRRHEVLRALRAASRPRRYDTGPVGRRRRLLLRRPASADGRAACRCGCARWSGSCRCAPPTTLGTATLERAARLRRALPWFLDATGPRPARRRPDPRARRRRRQAAVDRRRRSSWSGSCGAMLDEAEFLSPHGLRVAVPPPPRPSRSCSRWPATRRRGRLRAGRVDDRPVRRQLQLARPGVVPAQLPDHRGAAPLRRRSSATTSRSSTRPGRAEAHPARGRRRPEAPAGRASSSTTADGRRPVFGASSSSSTDPRWRDQLLVPRVLPRRHRRGAGRLPPDRLDRARRGAAAAPGMTRRRPSSPRPH